jgi:hypothetical protein
MRRSAKQQEYPITDAVRLAAGSLGARVIATTSTAEKAKRLKALAAGGHVSLIGASLSK